MKNVLILERSNQNLKKVSQKGKTILEGVFAEFGVENRNGRVYEERIYLPHLEYLKSDIKSGSLLGELDHPERFEVALSNVSHRVTDLWYDQNARQVKGRIEIIEGTPKGQIAKSLLDAGIPLSISSRAAGTVNEDKTVDIQQIYTYDLVAKPGFEKAQLETVNESVKSRIENQISQLNESYSKFKKNHDDLTSELGIVNENVSIYDLTDKYPALSLRDEAKELVKNKNEKTMNVNENVNEEKVQQWTLYFKNELSKQAERLVAIENAILEGAANKDDSKLLEDIKNLKKLQESHQKWTADIAKKLNKVATHSQRVAEKSNEHYNLTKKISETVDYNATVVNHTQDWVGRNAEVTNLIAETVDHNAEMLNGINEWNTQLAKGVNALHEWGSEKAKAINEMHEWTSSIAKGLNTTATWGEEMFGRAMSKSDAKKLVEYIELVSESKADPKMKQKLDEILSTNNITEKPLNESMITGIKGVPKLGVITDVTSTGNEKVDTNTSKDKGVEFDSKYKTIVAKMRKGSKVGGGKPKELKTLDGTAPTVKLSTGNKVKGIMTLDVQKNGSKPTVKITGDGPTPKIQKDQKLKLDTKPVGKLKEDFNKSSAVISRRSKLDEKLSSIIQDLEKEKRIDEDETKKFPFISILSESERKEFRQLSSTQKEKVANEISKNPTVDAGVIRNLWECALSEQKDDNPLWLKAAPKEYKKLYEEASDIQKGAIKARAEFYQLDTQYQINTFWETSGLVNKPISLNEVFTAKTPEESDKKLDSYVAAIGDAMKKYNR
jgi:hypothetical protein